MKQAKGICVGSVLVALGLLIIGAARATPLATFDWATAHDYVNLPIRNADSGAGPFNASGVLTLDRPDTLVVAMGTAYRYDYSLIAYFDFIYGFVDRGGNPVTDQLFTMLFPSPDDYINLGEIPSTGTSLTYTLDGQDLIAKFNDRFHGLRNVDWSITGFRASVRHVYQPVTEPATLLLVASIAAMVMPSRKTARPNAHQRRNSKSCNG